MFLIGKLWTTCSGKVNLGRIFKVKVELNSVSTVSTFVQCFCASKLGSTELF